MPKYTYWTTGEIEDLRRMKTFEKLSNKEVGIALGRTEISITTQSKKYKILKFEHWSEQNEDLLKKLVFNTHSKMCEITKKIGKTETAIKAKMGKTFGSSSLKKLRNESFLKRSETKFTELEIEFLKKNYYKKGAKECTKILKRTKQSIKNKVWELKKHGVKFEEQFIPRFSGKMLGYVIYSNETGKIIERYESLKEWHNKKELIEIENKKFNSRRCKVSERTET